MTDNAIIDLYWIRSELAIQESQNAYGPYCFRIANGILRDSYDSEESVNDTWLAAWKAMPPTRPGCLKSFFGVLTRRISVSRLRERQAEKRGGRAAVSVIDEFAECIPSTWSMEKAIEDKDLIRAFNAFLEKEPEVDRNLFIARYWYGLPVAEIAAKFSVKPNTVLTKLRRTRGRLLSFLEKEELL